MDAPQGIRFASKGRVYGAIFRPESGRFWVSEMEMAHSSVFFRGFHLTARRLFACRSSHLHSTSIDKGNPGSGDGTKEFREIIPTTGRTIFQRLAGSTPEVADSPDPVIQAPPSDYFLGYGSPGTQIWSRLRSAGLETQRVYALDTRRVMLKVRCPVDRLEDVAEALKLKLKTKSGKLLR